MAAQDLHAEAITWLTDFHKHMDSLNAEVAVPKFFAEDCVLSFAENPPITGVANIKDFLSAQYQYLESMHHTIKRVDVVSDRIYQEADIRYVVKGDPERKEILIKGIALVGKRPKQEKMNTFTVYLDPTALKERIAAVVGGEI
ncbi:hypothetical protein UA08_00034 [Talaromyces atroroseus]|uniref:SnoaL-like domain-containing protein n=1 Tax=Talaromyces atroroseus TaxID=1441469 RepID=A0A225AQ60_TALAT|nr:hypothetical protein UA08_00034 [Talaromyces atroroseus]OKL63761.1 hypothetical protein UA08_00034 [Talaromyces atroroseus]